MQRAPSIPQGGSFEVYKINGFLIAIKTDCFGMCLHLVSSTMNPSIKCTTLIYTLMYNVPRGTILLPIKNFT